MVGEQARNRSTPPGNTARPSGLPCVIGATGSSPATLPLMARSGDRPALHGYDCNSLKKVRAFVDQGGDVNAPVVGFLSQSLPPLHWAAFYQAADVVEFLLQHGADRNAKNSRGLTVLQVAMVRGSPPAIMKLLQRE